VSLFVSLSIPVAVGYLLASWFLSDDAEVGVFERLFLGYGLGLGLLSLEMLVLGLLGVPYTIFSITAVQFLFSLVLVYLMYRGGGVKEALFSGGIGTGGRGAANLKSGWKLYLSLFLVIWVFFKMGLVVQESIVRPMYAWDTWANWSAGAKLFFYEKGLVLDTADENFFGKGYRVFLGHPLNTPLLQVWIALWEGAFHEAHVKAWAAFYYISLMGILFLAVTRDSNPFYGIISVFFLSTVPILTFHGMEGYADLPLSYYGLAATVCLWRYMGTEKRGYLIVSGALLGAGCFTKNEGLLFFLAILAVLCLFIVLERKKPLPAVFSFLIAFLVMAGPWFLFKALGGFGFGHGGEQSAMTWFGDPKVSAGVARGIHWDVIAVALKEIFFKANFNLIFPFWIVLTGFALKTVFRTNLKYLYIVILALMAMFMFIYLIFESTAVTEITGLHRNTLTYVPIIFFASAVLAARIWPPRVESPLTEDGPLPLD
jgi:hypothetical protein